MQFIDHLMCSANLVDRTYRQFEAWKNVIIKEPKIIFDVGANVGVYSCFFSKYYPNSTIYAFEPVLKNYENLLKNLELNNVKNVKTFNFGFLSEEKTELMGIPKKRDAANTGLYSIHHNKFQDVVECNFKKFDDWCDANNVFPDLIKLDTEGTEYEILSGMTRLEKIDYLITENNHKNYPENAANIEFILQNKFNILEKDDDFLWGKHSFKAIYNTDFDKCGREFVKKTIEEISSKKDAINMLVLGSPDVKEFSLIADGVKEKINLFVLDTEEGKGKEVYKGFKSFYFKKINVFNYPFDGLVDQIDIVFHRWFLHHCNTEQKNESIKISKKVLKPDGKLIIIDWLIPDFNNLDEFKESLIKYYQYHMKFNVAPNPNKWMQNLKDLEFPNGHGGKFTSLNKLKMMLDENHMKYVHKFLCPDFIDNPELFGQSTFICGN